MKNIVLTLIGILILGSASNVLSQDLISNDYLIKGKPLSESKFYDNSNTEIPYSIIPQPNGDFISSSKSNPPFQGDWNTSDILIDTGQIVSLGYRQMILKSGPENSLYVVINKKSIVGQYNGKLNIYRSDNGGLNWILISTFQSPTLFFGQISMTVGNSTPSIEDSARVMVFFTYSVNSNLTTSALRTYSVRRDGSAPMGGFIDVAIGGHKFFYPSAFSNGFQGSSTEIGVVVGEYNNTTELSRSIRYYRSTDMGATFTGVTLIDPGYPTFSDYFPSADYKKGTTDSLYIAVERRSASDTVVRVISTPWTPTASASTHFLSTSPDNHEKPIISILKTDANDNATRKIMVTCIKNGGVNGGTPVYFGSNNAGNSWFEKPLGAPTQKDIKFAVCNSDPDTTEGGYFIAAYQDVFFNTADSITVRRGTLDSMGLFNFKINDTQHSSFVAPSVAIYKYTPAGGMMQKRSSVIYAGLGPINTYFDQENLPTGIVNHNTIATDFKLSQNYPNPFNPSTKIDFSIPYASNVKLVVYDMLGKEVATLVNKNLISGNYTYEFNGLGLASGVYIYRINVDGISGSFNEIKKMMLIK